MNDKHFGLKESLEIIAKKHQLSITDTKFAEILDELDELKHLRSEFCYPKNKDLPFVDLEKVNADQNAIYFCGNSLGLKPKGVENYIERELTKWAKMGVYGHFLGDTPWALCDEYLIDGNARLVGANASEIVVMNGLSVNLHLLLISFYRPTKMRHKILIESKAFPSDHYIVESQIRLHGFTPENSLICIEPRQGEDIIRNEDIIELINQSGDEIALILFSGVQYYTGQFFDVSAITKIGQSKGCVVGWDMAHAAGNVPLYLHEWNVDFAAWCSYKYLNSSCGGFGVVFVHERHANHNYPRLTGWWSHNKSTRMDMSNVMDLTPGAAGYRISNPPVMLMCPMLASLDIFNKTSMEELRKKSLLLTGYLEYLLDYYLSKNSPHRKTDNFVEIVTPRDPNQRGCQLSLKFSLSIQRVFVELEKRGVVCDKRLLHVLRVAPIHMYNNFTDVRRFVDALQESLQVSSDTLAAHDSVTHELSH